MYKLFILVLLGLCAGSGLAAEPCTTTLSPGANLQTAITSAAGGTVICLNNGTYSGVTLNNIQKNPRVIIQANTQYGATTSIGWFNGSSGFTVDGLTLTGTNIEGSGTSNITVKNSRFTGGAIFYQLNNANVLFDGNTHNNIDPGIGACSFSARIHFQWVSSGNIGVTIQNSQMIGGGTDGIQSGAGITVLNNIFGDIREQDGSDCHTDAIQLLTAPDSIIRGNYIYNSATGIVAYDRVVRALIEDNVVDLGGGSANRPWAIELYSDTNSIVRNNTLMYYPSCDYGQPCGILSLTRKPSDPISVGTIVQNNIATRLDVVDAGYDSANSHHNMWRSQTRSGDITGTPVYIGGSVPTTFAGFELAAGSPGKNAGTDGQDVGVHFTPSEPDTENPTTPTSLSAAAASSTQINLSWTASTDNVGIAGYDIRRCSGSGCTPSSIVHSTTGTGTTWNNTGLSASTLYRYDVRARDAVPNYSSYSSVAQATTQSPDTTPPSTPGTPSVTPVSNTQLNLSWTASTDNVGVSGYRVYRCDGTASPACTPGGAAVGTPTSNSYSDSGLTKNTTYRYRITAVDSSSNESSYSAVGQGTTLNNAYNTPTLDASTPAAIKSSSATLTTAAFTAPSGSMLYVLLMNQVTVSAGPTSTGLTFTQRGSYGNSSYDTRVTLWTAPVGSAVSRTVSLTQSAAGNYALLKVLVVTGADATTPVGHLTGARGVTNPSTITSTYTSATDNSWGWLLYADWTQLAVPTAGTGQSVYDSYTVSGEDTYAIIRRTAVTPTAGTSVTLNVTAPSSASAQVAWLAFEMRAGSSGGGDTTPPTVSSRVIPSTGTTLVMGFNEAVNFAGSVPTLTGCSGGAATLTYASGSGSTSLTFNVSRTVLGVETGCVNSYTQPGNGIEDLAGNDLVSFSNQSVTNNSTQVPPDTTPPSVIIATADPTKIHVGNLTVTGTSSDAVGVSGCKWRRTLVPDSSNGTLCTGTTSFSCATSGYSQGANTLYVGCFDAAGNYGSDSMVVNYYPPLSAPTNLRIY